MKRNPKTGVLIQSRMSSSRMPGKMLMDLAGMPLVEYVYKRCGTAQKPDMIAVITSTDISDDPLNDYCTNHDITVFRGSLNNVLHRFVQAASFFNLDFVCRVCGDSPFVDPIMIDRMLVEAICFNYDYLSLTHTIDGFLSEIIKCKALEKSSRMTSDPHDIEHVTRHIRRNAHLFETKWIDMNVPYLGPGISITVDQPEDLEFCSAIAEDLSLNMGYDRLDFESDDVMRAIERYLK